MATTSITITGLTSTYYGGDADGGRCTPTYYINNGGTLTFLASGAIVSVDGGGSIPFDSINISATPLQYGISKIRMSINNLEVYDYGASAWVSDIYGYWESSSINGVALGSATWTNNCMLSCNFNYVTISSGTVGNIKYYPDYPSPLKIYTGGTTGSTDGTLETPRDQTGLTLTTIGTTAVFHMRCGTDCQNAEQITVNAPTDCEVSKDGSVFGATAIYAIGDIKDVNVPCTVKRTASTITETTWIGLTTYPRVQDIETEYY